MPQFAAAVSFRCPVWLSFDCWWPKKLLNWNTELHYSLCTSTLHYKVGMNFVGEMVRRVRPRKVTKARSWPCTFKASITYFGDSWKVWRSGCVLHVWATTANPKGAWCASFSKTLDISEFTTPKVQKKNVRCSKCLTRTCTPKFTQNKLSLHKDSAWDCWLVSRQKR